MKFVMTLLIAGLFFTPSYAEDCTSVEKLKPRMIQVLKEGRGAGTGVLLDQQHILTAYHVIEGMPHHLIWVKSFDDPWTLHRADFLRTSSASDLVLLRLEQPINVEAPKLTLAQLSPNEYVRFFGFAFAQLNRFGVIEGYYKGAQRVSTQADVASHIELYGRTFGGDSGGPLFTCDGRLAGIEIGNRAHEGRPQDAYFVTSDSIEFLLELQQ